VVVVLGHPVGPAPGGLGELGLGGCVRRLGPLLAEGDRVRVPAHHDAGMRLLAGVRGLHLPAALLCGREQRVEDAEGARDDGAGDPEALGVLPERGQDRMRQHDAGGDGDGLGLRLHRPVGRDVGDEAQQQVAPVPAGVAEPHAPRQPALGRRRVKGTAPSGALGGIGVLDPQLAACGRDPGDEGPDADLHATGRPSRPAARTCQVGGRWLPHRSGVWEGGVVLGRIQQPPRVGDQQVRRKGPLPGQSRGCMRAGKSGVPTRPGSTGPYVDVRETPPGRRRTGVCGGLGGGPGPSASSTAHTISQPRTPSAWLRRRITQREGDLRPRSSWLRYVWWMSTRSASSSWVRPRSSRRRRTDAPNSRSAGRPCPSDTAQSVRSLRLKFQRR
jgi:hypothetical protein